MAIFIPEKPISFNSSFGEKLVFESLRRLDDNWYVFHSFRWINGQRKAQGEGDFVILHPELGILSIEVKSGGIRLQERSWYQRNLITGEEREIFNPLAQADSTKFKIIELLRGVVYRPEGCFVCSGVWFPSITMVNAALPPDYASEIVLDDHALENPAAALRLCFEFWLKTSPFKTSLTAESVRRIIGRLAPDFDAIPSLQRQLKAKEQVFVSLTAEQTGILRYLREQNTAVIHGAAGTGKTAIALEKARYEAARGDRVLFLCYNAALRHHLKANFAQKGIDFHNIHSLAESLRSGEELRIDELPDFLMQVLGDEDIKWLYDHVIIDEGQDFDSVWIDTISRRTNGCFYVFYDRNQMIQQSQLPKWVDEAECRLTLHINCRNTKQIANAAYYPIDLINPPVLNEVGGKEPVIYLCTNRPTANGKLKEVLTALAADYGQSGVTILNFAGNDASTLTSLQAVIETDFSEENNGINTRFSNPRKFKGLESPAVILWGVTANTFAEKSGLLSYYTAATRAIHELIVFLFIEDNRDTVKIVSALAGDRKISRDLHGLSRMLKAKIVTTEDL